MWSYKIVKKLNDLISIEELELLGTEGWEMISVIRHTALESQNREVAAYTYYFKMPYDFR